MRLQSSDGTERWCNEVAAEFLIPAALLQNHVVNWSDVSTDLQRMARTFKVSTLVVLRRLFDVGLMTLTQYRKAYAEQLDQILEILEARSGSGGNFYNTQPLRVSKRFTRAIIESTQEGQTLHRDALQMLGFKKMKTFNELAVRLGASDGVSA
jgi:Zn-dependent peptidase ImmA (M78 family)